jgi:Rap guanine nucleotide exchange factor 4
VNGRIFIAHADHLDALTTLTEQDGPTKGSSQQLEEFSSQDFAYHLTLHGWQLFHNLHDYELIYHVFGRHNFNEITANLDVFLRHFNEIQYWTVTELVLEKSLSRRVQLLRKLIKIAGQ